MNIEVPIVSWPIWALIIITLIGLPFCRLSYRLISSSNGWVYRLTPFVWAVSMVTSVLLSMTFSVGGMLLLGLRLFA